MLICEEAHTIGKHCHLVFLVSIIVCDHKDDFEKKCETGYLLGIGLGDNLSDDQISDLARDGWKLDDDRDLCPEHAKSDEE